MLRALLPVLLLLVACGPLPQPGPERGLYVDLRAIVETEQRTDWVVDRLELDQIGPRVLLSGCQVAPAHRQALREWLDARLVAEGGPLERAWAREQDLDAISEVLTLHRVRLALDYVETYAEADCPPWLQPDEAFSGVQADDGRFVLMLETLGGLDVLFGREGNGIGGGGAGRLLPAWGVDSRLTLATGIELGVSSTFPRGDEGTRVVEAALTGAIPLLARFHRGTWRFDTEIAATVRAPDRGLAVEDARFGLRLGQGLGVSTLRIAGLLPYAGIWAAHEWLPAVEGERALHILRLGTRFGVNWDP